MSERTRAFGGKQNLTSKEFPIAKHGSLWLVAYKCPHLSTGLVGFTG